MVILIGGISSTGKTLLAQRLLEHYHIPYLSIDHLKMGLIKGQWDCGFTAQDNNETIGKRLWPILKGIITTTIENGQHLMIEGCYLLPELVKDFEPEYLNQIITLYIGFSKNYIENNFQTKIIGHRSEIEQRMYEEDRSVGFFVQEHSELKKQCQIEEIPYFEINQNYEEEMRLVYEWIDREIENKKSIAMREIDLG